MNLKPVITLLCFSFGLLFYSAARAQQTFTISGTVTDSSTGETLVGASVRLVDELGIPKGVSTNTYGFYSITAPQGEYDLLVTYIGYTEQRKKLLLNEGLKINISLVKGTMLDEVVVSSGERRNENIINPQMGVEKLNMKTLENIPVLFGEKDVLKTIQLLPGIKSGGEGTTGFYVRGGGSDQNLILLDEATVYNSAHLLGFFSTFNSDAIKDAQLYKGGMPAQYGGRLSSVLDVTMNDGNNQKFGMEGGIGLISSRLKAEGPLVKNKGSFMISARRTYIDLLLKTSSDSAINNNTLNFYDLNAKFNYRFNDRNRVYISGYFGKDKIGIKTLFSNDWGNSTATIRFNHVFSDRLFSNTSLIYNKYSYAVELLDESSSARVTSLIRDYNLKEDLQYFSGNHNLRMGLHATHHRIAPSDIAADPGSSFNSLSLENRYGLELSAYLSDEWKLTEKFNIQYGLRVSTYSLLGPGTISEYDNTGNITATKTYKTGDFVKSYLYPEPRFSAGYNFSDLSSVKASYNRNTQNIHILTNSNTSSPTDQYVMSSNNIRPELADQLALGYFRNSKNNGFEFSSEVYYKWLKNQIDYRDGAELIANADVEGELLYGKGRAYGLELYAKKTKGRVTGWISYTISKTERKFDEINNGRYYPTRQDRTHDIALVGIYNLSKRWSFSANYIYNTGNAITYPVGKYTIGGLTTYYYTDRNASRMPHTERLDLSATLKGRETKKFSSSWNFSAYNALARENPYAINFRNKKDDPNYTEAVQIALFKIIPSVTWNFKF